jgi:hypothetical protein
VCSSTTCTRGRRPLSRRRHAGPARGGRYPSRNIEQNLADLRAQVAACAKGTEELHRMVAHFGLPVVRAYMQHVQDNAEEAVRRVLDVLTDGTFTARWTTARCARGRSAWIARRARRPSTSRYEPAAADQLQRDRRPSARPRCCTCSARWSTTRSR